MSRTHNGAMAEDTAMQRENIPEEDLLEEIRRLADGDDPPTKRQMDDEGQYSATTYQDRFGSWNAAINEAMGEDTVVRRRDIPEEDLLAEIRRLEDGDDPPTKRQMDDEGQYSVSTYYRRFESWNAAIREALGEDVELNTGGSAKIPEADLLAELRRLATDGQPPKLAAMRNEGRYGTDVYRNRFGSWADAVRLAMERELQRMTEQMGRFPTPSEYTAEVAIDAVNAIIRYGSWEEFIEASAETEPTQ